MMRREGSIRSVETAPQLPEDLEQRARLLIKQGRFDEARDAALRMPLGTQRLRTLLKFATADGCPNNDRRRMVGLIATEVHHRPDLFRANPNLVGQAVTLLVVEPNGPVDQPSPGRPHENIDESAVYALAEAIAAQHPRIESSLRDKIALIKEYYDTRQLTLQPLEPIAERGER